MHNRIEQFVATLLGIAAIISVSAQALDSPSTTPALGASLPLDAQGDGRQQALDLATTASVKSALQKDSELKTQTILVETINGLVRLTGAVTSASNLDRAKDVVKKVDGVKDVENLLVVKELVKPLS
jgi:osmotically-inducible protein OsmY